MLFYTHNPSKFAFSRVLSDIDTISNKDVDMDDINDYFSSESLEDRKLFGLVGVPFDSTTTYRPGARFGPAAVREASYNFENYNLTFDCSLDTVFFDFGDLEVVPGNYKQTCNKLEETVSELLGYGLIPIIIGGDHSISYGILKAIKSHMDYSKHTNLAKDFKSKDKTGSFNEVTVIHFDAHMDIIDQYAGDKYSHATVMRRIFELSPQKIIQLGVRSASREEKDFVQKQNEENQNTDDGQKIGQKIEYYMASDIRQDMGLIENILDEIEGPIYLSVDIDVLDPSEAPTVGTPAPGGISSWHLEKLISILSKKEIIGFDLVEVAADRIGDITSINAAKIIYDFLCLQD
jgi:agmatinase